MKELLVRVNKELVGVCRLLKISQSTPSTYFDHGTSSGMVNQIKFDSLHSFRSFIETIKSNAPMELEFENDDCMWTAYRAWSSKYSYSDGGSFSVVMDEFEFECEMLKFIRKTKMDSIIEKEINVLSPEYQEMINKFAAAVSSHYKKDK